MSGDEQIGILGAGAFGVGLATMLGRANRPVLICSTRESLVEQINRDHRVEGLVEDIPPCVRATSDVQELADSARFLVIAVSSDAVRARLQTLGQVVHGNHLAVHAAGAFAGEERVTEVIRQETAILRTGVIAGPALAADLIAGRSASLVCASEFEEVSKESRRLLGVPPMMRLYRNHDVVGAEWASALSGVYTISLGLSDGLGIGLGTRAVLFTRILSEMVRLGQVVGAVDKTFTGLAGLGNLLVRSATGGTWSSYLLGRSLCAGHMESNGPGANAARAAGQIAVRYGLRMPVLETTLKVLDGVLSAQVAAAELAKTVAEEE